MTRKERIGRMYGTHGIRGEGKGKEEGEEKEKEENRGAVVTVYSTRRFL